MMAARRYGGMGQGFKFNIMEMKCCERGRGVFQSQILIVPLWN